MHRWMEIVLACLVMASCAVENGDGRDDAGADTGTDSDTDTDTDTDSDSDDPFYTDPGDLPAGDSPCREPVLVLSLLEVVDGDTIWVDMEDGPHEKVRFIGVDTPEMGSDGEEDECFAWEAAEFTRWSLEGDRFWLTFDEGCEDVYGRTLAYVHTRAGFLQLDMLEKGFAEVMTVPPNDTFATDFEQAEAQAVEQGAGMWGECR